MTRAGRGLELTVATVEGALVGTGCQVRSPDYLDGRESGSRREVDVSIRGRLGSADILVMVECRDRGGKAGIDWIEQIASKKGDVGADKAIAVARQGFSAPAERVAASRGIILRTVEELDSGEVLSWLGVSELVVIRAAADISCEPEVAGNPSWKESPKWQSWNLPQELRLELAEGGQRAVTLAEAWDRTVGEHFWKDVPTDGTRVPVHAIIPLAGDAVQRVVDTPFGPAPVLVLRFHGEIWFDRTVVPVSGASSYLGPDGVIARSAEFSFEDAGTRLTVILHNLE